MNKTKRVISAIKNINHLVEGWSKIKTKLTKEQKRKLKICDDCEFCVDDNWLDMVDNEVVECAGKMCNKCGCPNIVVVRSSKKCKANKW